MDRNMDLIVIGAGPAELSAACTARLRAGRDPRRRASGPGRPAFSAISKPRWRRRCSILLNAPPGSGLVKRFRESGATYHPGTTVTGL